MSKHLEKNNLPKLTQEEIENLNILKPFWKLINFLNPIKKKTWVPDGFLASSTKDI